MMRNLKRSSEEKAAVQPWPRPKLIKQSYLIIMNLTFNQNPTEAFEIWKRLRDVILAKIALLFDVILLHSLSVKGQNSPIVLIIQESWKLTCMYLKQLPKPCHFLKHHYFVLPNQTPVADFILHSLNKALKSLIERWHSFASICLCGKFANSSKTREIPACSLWAYRS